MGAFGASVSASDEAKKIVLRESTVQKKVFTNPELFFLKGPKKYLQMLDSPIITL